MNISKKQAGTFLLKKQGLYGPHKFSGKDGILDYINQAGCIQFDPIDICGKNHELVLQSRIKGFRKQQLYELLYEDRKLIDIFDKNMAIAALEDWPYLDYLRYYHQNGGRGKEEIDVIADELLGFIKNNGPVCSADLQYNEKVNWYWAPTTLARAALDTLYYRGVLVIHHKKNTRKYYDLAENHIPKRILNAPNPNASLEDKNKWHLLRRIKSIGLLWNRASDAWLGINDFKAENRNAAFSQLLSDGSICEIAVDGIKFPFYIPAEDMDILSESIQSEVKSTRLEFIAPLDNMMWDRRLINEIFGFDYKWEIYTPEKDRKYGYYVLPILYGDEFAGRIEIRKNAISNKLEATNIWLEEKTLETKKLHESIKCNIKKLNSFYNS